MFRISLIACLLLTFFAATQGGEANADDREALKLQKAVAANLRRGGSLMNAKAKKACVSEVTERHVNTPTWRLTRGLRPRPQTTRFFARALQRAGQAKKARKLIVYDLKVTGRGYFGTQTTGELCFFFIEKRGLRFVGSRTISPLGNKVKRDIWFLLRS